MPLQSNFTRKVQRGAFNVERVLRKAIECRQRHKQRRKFRMVDNLKVQFLLRVRCLQGQIQRNHRRRRAELARHRCQVIADNRANGACDVDDFR